jgi:uncharacterized protein (DUF2147 family)
MRSFPSAVVAFGFLSHPAVAAGIEGDWLVAEGTAVIRVEACGEARCGKVAWTPAPASDEARSGRAKEDESPIGTTILIDMKPAGEQRWDGQIYNPQDGKTYTGRVTLLSPDVLKVEGCLLVFCGGETWTRTSSQPAAGVAGAGGRRAENAGCANASSEQPK